MYLSMKGQDCSICAFRKPCGRLVTCVKCAFTACKKCTQHFLIESKHPPMCCHCRHPWSDEFLEQSFRASWLQKQYRRSRHKLWMEREASLIPGTMPKVKRMQQLQTIQHSIRELRLEAKQVQRKIYRLQQESRRVMSTSRTDDPTWMYENIRCSKEGCKGYVSAPDDGICVVCHAQTCVKCYVLISEDPTMPTTPHICQTQDLETANTIRATTTPCPTCHTPIQKSEGCDQMFCILCHTPFSFRTGKVETGLVHNPHMYEIRQRLGFLDPTRSAHRNIGDIPCGGFPSLQEITEKLTTDHPNLRSYSRRLRVLQQISQMEMTRVQPRYGDICANLRTRYILGELNEKHFASMVARCHVSNQVNIQYTQIYEAFLASSQDVLMRLVRDEPEHVTNGDPTDFYLGGEDESDKLYDSDLEYDVMRTSLQRVPLFADETYEEELDQIIKYTNDALKSTGVRYGRSYPIVPTKYDGFEVLKIKMGCKKDIAMVPTGN